MDGCDEFLLPHTALDAGEVYFILFFNPPLLNVLLLTAIVLTDDADCIFYWPAVFFFLINLL